jgi:oligopeptide transport system ATP-binding protein
MKKNSNIINNPPSKTILSITNANKSFKSKWGITKAVDNVSFDLKQGEIIGLIGESGSGKTTIGRMLIRLIPDYSGFTFLKNYVISGKKIPRKNKIEMRKKIQMIFQDPHASLNNQKTVYSILREPLIVNKVLNGDLQILLKD